ncbi:hypothetical protein Trydic_g13884 [Trypoxylus dichotomus]
MNFDIFQYASFILIQYSLVGGTIDVNLPEYQYIANHLEPQECRKLVAALHFHSYDLPPSVNEAENLLDKDVPCIRLLLHWNSSPGEGRGETHEALTHRLRQLGREDLADWLGRTVFHELGKDIERSLNNPFNEFLTEKPNKSYYGPHYVEEVSASSTATEWIPFDTICYTAVVILLILIVCLFAKLLMIGLCKKRKLARKRKYNRLEECEDGDLSGYTTSESDKSDKFDIRQTI